MTDVLEDILTSRRVDVARAREKTPLAALEHEARAAKPAPDFFQAVTAEGRISLIAEMKAKSPSAGTLAADYDVEAIARAYEHGGAAALSVLTEPARFGGDIEHVRRAARVSSLPILRKDFVFDPYQIVEARAAGAAAVLLIADMVDAWTLRDLAACAREFGVEPLVEVFTSDVLPAAINSGARLIGINTRNLRTLEMYSDNVFHLSRLIPRDRAIVAESGIKTAADVESLKPMRVAAMLVGESLLKSANKEEAVRLLVQAGKRA
jgi:indole-3-glycerol phosphate synthase